MPAASPVVSSVGALRMTNVGHSRPGDLDSGMIVVEFSLLAVLHLASCSSSTTSETQQTGDASVSSGGSTSSTPGSGGRSGSGGMIGASGSAALDASSLDSSSADACDDGVVSNVVRSRGPQSSAEAGGPALIQRIDGGFVHITPTDPCVTYARPQCPGGPRSIFGCPSVVGPNGSTAIHPGDQITVKVPITDEGLGAYSCNGLSTDQSLVGGSELFYAVKPAYVQVSGRLPTSTKPGTVYHFTAEASGSRYTFGTACSNDLTRLDFDVTVGS
jgi:hypothetical protein